MLLILRYFAYWVDVSSSKWCREDCLLRQLDNDHIFPISNCINYLPICSCCRNIYCSKLLPLGKARAYTLRMMCIGDSTS